MIGAGRLFRFVRVLKDGESADKTKKTRINADALSAAHVSTSARECSESEMERTVFRGRGLEGRGDLRLERVSIDYSNDPKYVH
nr:hypothetical protein Iba_chr09cCG3560 [Ipomoea batatas]